MRLTRFKVLPLGKMDALLPRNVALLTPIAFTPAKWFGPLGIAMSVVPTLNSHSHS